MYLLLCLQERVDVLGEQTGARVVAVDLIPVVKLIHLSDFSDTVPALQCSVQFTGGPRPPEHALLIAVTALVRVALFRAHSAQGEQQLVAQTQRQYRVQEVFGGQHAALHQAFVRTTVSTDGREVFGDDPRMTEREPTVLADLQNTDLST